LGRGNWDTRDTGHLNQVSWGGERGKTYFAKVLFRDSPRRVSQTGIVAAKRVGRKEDKKKTLSCGKARTPVAGVWGWGRILLWGISGLGEETLRSKSKRELGDAERGKKKELKELPGLSDHSRSGRGKGGCLSKQKKKKSARARGDVQGYGKNRRETKAIGKEVQRGQMSST